MSKLAINRGEKIRNIPFPPQETIGKEESKAVTKFLGIEAEIEENLLSYSPYLYYNKTKNPILSGYRGNYSKFFYGGTQVQALEKEFSEKFNVKHSLAVNSCTSALIIACGAIGIQPGDQVLVTPFSMTCSATAPMIYGGIPIFADIEEDYYCLNPDSVKKQITEKTKAIIVVDLFGQSFAEEIIRIAKENNLYIIEDAAQAIGSYQIKYNAIETMKKYAGTLGHIGCFSFTQGKHLTVGEGGMITTNDDDLAMKCALIRNHAESVINDMNRTDVDEWTLDDGIRYAQEPNMVGFNMRMTEIQAVILREQLKKLDRFIQTRQNNIIAINEVLKDLPAIILANKSRKNCSHSYYVQAFQWDSNIAGGIHRDKFIDAVIAELTGEEGREDRPMLGKGYIRPLHTFPIFQHKNHWAYKFYDKNIEYKFGDCLTAEKLWSKTLFLSLYHNLPLTKKDIKDIQRAFWKVWENRKELF